MYPVQVQKIKISFIGYKDKEVTAKKGVSLNIVLEEDAQTLGEVQVVAYGVQKKVSITGAISSMKGDDLLKTPAGSLSMYYPGNHRYFFCTIFRWAGSGCSRYLCAWCRYMEQCETADSG